MTSDLVEAVARGICDARIPKHVVVSAEFAEECHRLARAAISAIEKAGFAVVPREPTQAMMQAYNDQFPPGTSDTIKQSWYDVYGEIYAAMLNAAPSTDGSGGLA